MWYLAEILFAEPTHPGNADCQCEACNVVLEAASAVEAYHKAIAWGQNHTAETPTVLRLLGVSHLTTVGDSLDDGTEICGRYFEAPSVWDGISELVPPPEQLKAIVWEQSRDVPLGQLLTPEQTRQLKRAWGQ